MVGVTKLPTELVPTAQSRPSGLGCCACERVGRQIGAHSPRGSGIGRRVRWICRGRGRALCCRRGGASLQPRQASPPAFGPAAVAGLQPWGTPAPRGTAPAAAEPCTAARGLAAAAGLQPQPWPGPRRRHHWRRHAQAQLKSLLATAGGPPPQPRLHPRRTRNSLFRTLWTGRSEQRLFRLLERP